MSAQSVDKARHRRARKTDNDKGDDGDGNGYGGYATSSTKVRRERNRQAQQVFRIRRQAEQMEKDQHIRKLENEIEQMGSIFFELADAITRSEHARADARLMQTLRNSMKRVVRLADDESAAGEQHFSSEDSDAPAPTPEAPVPLAVDLAEVPSLVVGRSSSSSSSATSAIMGSQVSGYHRANEELSGMLGSMMYNISPGLQLDVFSGSLSSKIIQGTLRYGLMVLSNALDFSNEIVKQLFWFTLQHTTREDMLLKMQWTLGAGNWFIPILASNNFHSEVSRNVVNSLAEKKSGQVIDLAIAPPHKRAEICMNAVEVEKYILSRSTGYVGEDVLELVIEDNTSFGSQQQQQPKAPQTRDYIDLDVFFPAEQRQPDNAIAGPSTVQVPRIMRISQTRLVQNIACISMCTSDGPGYRTDDLERVILSSAVESY